MRKKVSKIWSDQSLDSLDVAEPASVSANIDMARGVGLESSPQGIEAMWLDLSLLTLFKTITLQ